MQFSDYPRESLFVLGCSALVVLLTCAVGPACGEETTKRQDTEQSTEEASHASRETSADSEKVQSPSREQLEKWVNELSSDLFDTREKAQQQLERAGLAALEFVSEEARNGSLESSTRAINILLAWSETGDRKLHVEALERLVSLKNSPREAELAEQLLSRARENAAVAAIVELGGVVQVDKQVRNPSNTLQIIIGSKWKGGLEGLKHLAEVPRATTVSFHATSLGDKALEYLDDVPQLSRVELYGTSISEEAIDKLKSRLTDAVHIEIRSAALLGVQGDFGANAHVGGVMQGSAADKAGVKPGDIITKLDEEEVKDFAGLTRMIAKQQPGDTVTLTIDRQGKIIQLPVTFSKWGTDEAEAPPAAPMPQRLNRR